MAHYALLDENNVVTYVFPGKDENQDGVDWEKYYGEYNKQKCLRASYNTVNGMHLLGGKPFRKNYPAPGYIYDEKRDAFIPPKIYNGWVLNENTCQWEPPVQPPDDGKRYVWHNDALVWVEDKKDYSNGENI